MAMNFRADEDLMYRLRAQADAEHTSIQKLLAKAAEEYLSRNTKREMIAREMQLVKANYGETLRRLGDGA